MKNIIFILIIVIKVFIIPFSIYAQSDTLINNCAKYLTNDFISDGQEYRALLSDEETAEFRVTFFEGTTYRIICCNNTPDAVINFSLYDLEGNKFFSNKEYSNTPYWDFEFKSTIHCIINAQLDRTTVNSAVVFFLIGYKP